MNIIEKSLEKQKKIEEMLGRLGKGKYGRVLQLASHPDEDEYMKTSQLTAIGIFLIGFIGFIIMILATVVAPWIAEKIGL
ncbi:MAG: protein translocase SEC61 complex subunit gamma [Thermoplasmatales archaeon]|nr:protein translocase SEC61 complex subunit gamma [Thermoplasmatales archaeon]